MSLDILYEDNHLLVVAKPAGLPTQADRSQDSSLVDLAKEYRIRAENKPGSAFVGLVHRLDRPVSGIVVLARTSKSAARLSESFRRGIVDKGYLAVVEGDLPEDFHREVLWRDFLAKNRETNLVRVCSPSSHQAKEAITRVRLLERIGRRQAVLELSPVTGRSHQLRVQSSSRGLPIVGDRKYGSARRFSGGLALHAYRLVVPHPTRGERLRFSLAPPDSWRTLSAPLDSLDFSRPFETLARSEP